MSFLISLGLAGLGLYVAILLMIGIYQLLKRIAIGIVNLDWRVRPRVLFPIFAGIMTLVIMVLSVPK